MAERRKAGQGYAPFIKIDYSESPICYSQSAWILVLLVSILRHSVDEFGIQGVEEADDLYTVQEV